ncbi:MAG: T9SS type A sorting domain-containing protein [Saprospiraceae bacterium]
MDFDGSFEYSKTISLLLSNKEKYRIEQLRMSGDILLFDLLSDLEGKAILSIYNLNGNLLHSSNFNFNRGTEQVTQELGSLSAGLYYLSLNVNGHNLNSRFVKAD